VHKSFASVLDKDLNHVLVAVWNKLMQFLPKEAVR